MVEFLVCSLHAVRCVIVPCINLEQSTVQSVSGIRTQHYMVSEVLYFKNGTLKTTNGDGLHLVKRHIGC